MYSIDYFEILKSRFEDISIFEDKIVVNDIRSVLQFCKTEPNMLFDMLLTIIAVDYSDYIELIYPIMTSVTQEVITLSVKVNDIAQSVIDIYPSAYFDECEVFDLFGVNFIGNKKLKRLFMPESWQGFPLRKNYMMADERLGWNE